MPLLKDITIKTLHMQDAREKLRKMDKAYAMREK